MPENDCQILLIVYTVTGEVRFSGVMTPALWMDILGMMTRCTLKSGITKEGFIDPFYPEDGFRRRCEVKDAIELWTWANLDEETHRLIGDGDAKYEEKRERIPLNEIVLIEAVMHSNPRWGGRLTNHYAHPWKNSD